MAEADMNEILQRLTRVETRLDIMNSARDTAQDAHHSAKSAHHRLDELREELIANKQTVKWLIGTTISLGGLAVSAIGILIKVVSG